MPAPGQSQEADNSLGPLWITVAFFVLGAFIWYFFSTYIIAFVFTIRFYEAELMSIFIPSGWAENLVGVKQFILTAKQGNYSEVTFNDLLNVSVIVGDYVRYPVMAVLAGLGILLYIGNPINSFKKVYNMQTLLEREKANWPQIMPVSRLDLLHTDIDKGPWAMALQPMQFAKKHNLLVVEKLSKNVSRFESKMPPTASINRDEARRIFAMQLERYWTNPEALPIHARALFAVFAARVNGDREGAVKLLNQISLSAGIGKLNFSGTDELLRKHKDNKYIIRLTQRHAFELTVMPSMLEFARQDGVLAVADFLWLKPVDRRLWYMLNCVGRQTPFVEVAGAFAHWIAEKEFGRRLNVPMVEEAVNGLEIAVKEFIFNAEEND